MQNFRKTNKDKLYSERVTLNPPLWNISTRAYQGLSCIHVLNPRAKDLKDWSGAPPGRGRRRPSVRRWSERGCWEELVVCWWTRWALEPRDCGRRASTCLVPCSTSWPAPSPSPRQSPPQSQSPSSPSLHVQFANIRILLYCIWSKT